MKVGSRRISATTTHSVFLLWLILVLGVCAIVPTVCKSSARNGWESRAATARRHPFLSRQPEQQQQQQKPFGVNFLSLRGGSGDEALDLDVQEEETANTDEAPEIAAEETGEEKDPEELESSTIDGDEALSQSGETEETVDSNSTTDATKEKESSSPRPEPSLPAVVETTTTTVLEHDPVTVVVSDPSADVGADTETVIDGSPEDVESSVVDETHEETEPLTDKEIEEAVQKSSELRTEGKKLHDEANFVEAAAKFAAAGDLLAPVLATDDSVADDFATCRLHQALCCLKSEEYGLAIVSCTEVLELPQEGRSSVEPALRARAFHRRAKARVELGEAAAALQDARSAAFLGDRKAVALYGKLMRESSGGSSSFIGDSNSDLTGTSALFESLLNKSTLSLPSTSDSSSVPSPLGGMGNMSPSSLLDMLGATKGDSGESGAGGLAKSVMSSLSKRLNDESTQDQICNFLQSTSGPQLQQMAGMAGLELQEGQANRLASFCQGVTPQSLRRTMRTTRAVYSIFQFIRKVSRLIAKYRSVIILIFIVGWIKSAMLRPFPVNKRAARLAAKEAAKAAASLAIDEAATPAGVI